MQAFVYAGTSPIHPHRATSTESAWPALPSDGQRQLRGADVVRRLLQYRGRKKNIFLGIGLFLFLPSRASCGPHCAAHICASLWQATGRICRASYSPVGFGHAACPKYKAAYRPAVGRPSPVRLLSGQLLQTSAQSTERELRMGLSVLGLIRRNNY